MVFLFLIPFGCIYHARTFTHRQNHPSISMVQNSVDPNTNLDTKKIHSPRHTHQISILTGITLLLPKARIFDTIIDVDR